MARKIGSSTSDDDDVFRTEAVPGIAAKLVNLSIPRFSRMFLRD